MHLKIFYSISEETFIEEYKKLEKEYNHSFSMITKVKEEVINFIQDSDSRYICLLTDEDVFYRRVNRSRATVVNRLFEENKDLLSFSLRLGRNVINNKQFQSHNIIIPINNDTDDHLMVDWSKHYLDFGFPLCVHGHIFRRKEIRKLASKVPFNNFDDLQENLQIFDKFPKTKLASLNESVLVTDAPPPSQESDFLIKRILNIKLSKNEYQPVKVEAKAIDGIQTNFGVYAMIFQNLTDDTTQD
jgi:hypothetical protein